MAGGYVTDCVPWEGSYGRYYWRCMARGAEGRYATLHVHIPIQIEEVSMREVVGSTMYQRDRQKPRQRETMAMAAANQQ